MITGAMAMPAAALLDEIDVSLHSACASVQGLLDLLGDAPQDRPIRGEGLRQLLLPMADQLEQAVLAAALLQRAGQALAGATS